ncbi:lipopolysaccharide assembly protein LapA domain-containing protein [Bauldia sp.]|uniref:lipopolysaccharide assembly protein LapA domain-containing protein n=1 Tax=Bauldia sp. TaxID=2575872 RepID=UPI003BAC72A6
MRRFVFYILVVPLAVVLIILSVANRHAVTLSFDPFDTMTPTLSVSVPLFVLLFAALVIGVVVGGVAVWFRQGRWRRLARDEKIEIDRLKREADERPPIASGPALPAAQKSS